MIKSNEKQEMGLQIVVMDRGFVYAGRTTIEGDIVTISGAKNIRRWGTTKGLGELINGPKSQTVVDDAGEVVAPLKAVIHFIKCNAGW